MLKRYIMRISPSGAKVVAAELSDSGASDFHGAYEDFVSPKGWVRYEDAAALELRIRELEQQIMTEAEKRAAFEADC